MLEGWGRIVHRRRWLVLGASLLLLASSGALLARGGELQNPDSVVSSESGRASALLNSDLPKATGGPTPGTSFVVGRLSGAKSLGQMLTPHPTRLDEFDFGTVSSGIAHTTPVTDAENRPQRPYSDR